MINDYREYARYRENYDVFIAALKRKINMIKFCNDIFMLKVLL